MSTVCRVCLTGGGGNVKLCSLEDVRLKDVYRKLTNTRFYSENGRPRVVCSFCYRNLLRCWTLSEMACRSENFFSKLLFKGLEATHETIEDLRLEMKQNLSVAPMQVIDMDNETPTNSSAIIIKEEPILVKEEETVQIDELVDTESADTYISKNHLIFEENTNYLIENSIEINIVQPDLKKDSEKLDSDQERKENQKVEVHPDKSMTFCCNICNKMFLFRSGLVSHNQLTHAKELQCKIYNAKLSDFRFKRLMKVHTYACSTGDKQFKHKSTLVKHMRTHTGEKPYICGVCDKRFIRNSLLVRHMRIHTGEKPYACGVCGKQFTDKSNLISHMTLHTGDKPYACSTCDKQFNHKCRLVSHMRIHTGEKPYACGVCHKQFYHKGGLVKHIRIHTGEKPYACGVCHKQFNQKSSLVTHMRIHTGVKPYACSVCDKQFYQKCHLVRHMRSHTGIKP